MTSLRYLSAFLIVAGIAAALDPQPAQAELIGLVKRVVSDAYGTPPKLEREKKHPRFPVVQDELLETGKDSAILVEFLDKTLLTLGSESRLTIDTMVYDPKSHDGAMVLKMTVGVLRFVSGKIAAAGVRIVTPSALIGIRGSDALIIVKPDGSTTINVFSGVFFVSGPEGGEETAVNPAQAVSVTAAGAVGAVGPGMPSPPGTPGEGSTPGQGGGGGPVEPPAIGPGPPGDPAPPGGAAPPGDPSHPGEGGGWPPDPTTPPGTDPGAGPGEGGPGGGNGGDHPDTFGHEEGDDHDDDHGDDDQGDDGGDDGHGDGGGNGGGNGH